eukprot:RCo031300
MDGFPPQPKCPYYLVLSSPGTPGNLEVKFALGDVTDDGAGAGSTSSSSSSSSSSSTSSSACPDFTDTSSSFHREFPGLSHLSEKIRGLHKVGDTLTNLHNRVDFLERYLTLLEERRARGDPCPVAKPSRKSGQAESGGMEVAVRGASSS